MTRERAQILDRPLPEIARMMRIVQIVAERQRNMPPERGVLPVTVQAFINQYRAEQTLRRDMAALAKAGYLDRLGGDGSRRGYRVAVEQAAVRRVEWPLTFQIGVR